PACAPVASLSAGSITSTTASLSFTAGAGNTSFRVTYRPTGGAATTVTPAPTASPVALTSLTPNTTYSVSVIGNCAGGDSTTAVTTTFTTLPLPPANDECTTATAIPSIGVGTCGTAVNGTNVGATASSTTGTPAPGCASYSGGDVWFRLTVPANGIVQVQTDQGTGTSISDSGLALYSGSCGSLTLISCDDDSGSGAFSFIRATGLTPGATLYARVWEYGNDEFGTFTICAQTDPACAAPTALTASSITTTTASLGFTAGTGNTSFRVTYRPTGGAATTVTPAPTTSPVALTGLTPNTTYSVSVIGNCAGGDSTTAVTTTFTTLPLPPANDNCATATVISCGQTLNGTTVGATTTGDPTGSCSGNAPSSSPGVFYSFVGTGDVVTVTTCTAATAIDTKLFVYSGTCAALTCVGSNDDDNNCTSSGASTVTFTSVVGTTYYFMVQRFGAGNTGTFALNVTCAPAPPANLVVTSPQNVSGTYNNVTVQSGGVATLTGTLTVNGTLTVQTGGILAQNCQPLNGPGSFVLQTGAELRICDPAGIAPTGATGAIQLTGTRTYASDASYTYNGTAAQVTGAGLPATVRNLTVNNATGLTLSQAVSIAQVANLQSGNLTTAGFGFTLLSSASGTALIDNTGGIVTGIGTMQRAITNAVTGPAYRHFSSPVQSTTLADLATTGFAPTFNTSYNNVANPSLVTPFPTVFGYDQARIATVTSTYGAFDKGWFSPTGPGDVMQPTRGYTVNAPATATPIDFVGTFNNATQNSGTLSRGTDAQAGWQLLGNPYPSPLDWSTVTAGQRPGMDGAMYVYQSTGQYAGTYRSFDNGVGASPLIVAGSGYFARVTAPGGSGSVNLTNANRVTIFGAQPTFGRGNDTRPQLHLTLTGAGHVDETFLYLQAGATTAIEPEYDAIKLANPTGLDLASLSGNEALAINGLAPLSRTDVVVPLLIRAPQAGTFSFEAAELANFGATTVFLRDALTGTQQQLTAGTRYSFALATASAGAGRFSVVFRPANVTATRLELDAASVSLYPNPAHGSFTVLLPPLAGQREVHAMLVNALGQVVLSHTIGLTAAGATAEFSTQNLATGVYTLRLQAENQFLTKRVVLE
ncbi:fibronectin type III domain-containing protein, partial [Hymenobacter negativus]